MRADPRPEQAGQTGCAQRTCRRGSARPADRYIEIEAGNGRDELEQDGVHLGARRRSREDRPDHHLAVAGVVVAAAGEAVLVPSPRPAPLGPAGRP